MSSPGQQGTPFPLQDFQITDPSGKLTLPWSRLFTLMWSLLGGQTVPGTGSVVLRFDSATGVITAYQSSNGQLIGTIPLQNQPGGAPVPFAVGASPQVFSTEVEGFFVVFAAQVEISRDAGANWYLVTLQGGAVPVRNGDEIRVTWFGANKPTVTFFPDFA